LKPSKTVLCKSDEEIELMRLSNLLVSKTLAHVASMIRPGLTYKVLDLAAERFILESGGRPAFKGFKGFPASLCISVNEQVVHGIPTDRVILDTDVISVDCGVEMNGFYGDSAYTFAMQGVSAPVQAMLAATLHSLHLGIEQVKPGNRIGDIGFAIQDFIERKCNYGVVRELVGHGIGRNLHEEPEVPNFGRRGTGPVLKSGMTIAIEPMVNEGTRQVKVLADGWTIITRDLKPSAHYEHTVAVRPFGHEILSDHSIVEAEIKNNSSLLEISTKF
jgi:methionyl aminopeptidase